MNAILDVELRLDCTETKGDQFGSFGRKQERDGDNLHQIITVAVVHWVWCVRQKRVRMTMDGYG